MNDIFDFSITNAERVLLGMPLLVRITICCPQSDKNMGDCADLEGRIGIYLGKTSIFFRRKKYYIGFSPSADVSAVEIEVLP